MNANENQKTILSTKNEIEKFKKRLWTCEGDISKYGRKLVCELRELPGWECMILACRNHYDKYPHEFFDWCLYELGECEYENHLLVKKYYQNDDPDGYIVLDIDLTKSLEEQLENRKNALSDEEKKQRKLEEDKERAEYERLKAKFEKQSE